MNRNLSKLLLAGGCVFVFTVPAFAGKFTVLHKFKGRNDGMRAVSTLTPDGQGNFYGTTSKGGKHAAGTVFRIGRDGTLTTIYAFKGGSDGASPVAGVNFGPDGALYGTTVTGGVTSSENRRATNGTGGTECNANGGCGIVFRLTTDGHETIVHVFTGELDGAHPEGSVTFDRKGNLYGTTAGGGMSGGAGSGTVYKILPKGKEKILHAFGLGVDAEVPVANVVLDKAGNIFGAALEGTEYQEGAIFKITPDGVESLLHALGFSVDGGLPASDLMIDKTGNLYGTAAQGGEFAVGTVFKVAQDGEFTVLHHFAGIEGDTIDGSRPNGGVVADAKGNLYGTTREGGAHDHGVIYKIAPDGKETLLHEFTGGNDGSDPSATLALDDAGNIYGTTVYGGSTKGACGSLGCGTVFRLTP